MNALASVIRGTGNMLVPSLAVCLGVVLLVPLSPLPDLRVWAASRARHRRRRRSRWCSTTALTAWCWAWYILAGRSVVRFAWARLRVALFADILRVGGVASISARCRPRLTVVLTTALVGRRRGAATRSPATAPAAGSNICWCRWCSGSARRWWRWSAPISAPASAQRALRVALIGGGDRLRPDRGDRAGRRASWPRAWLGLFGDDPQMLAAGTAVSAQVGPVYGFFGLGLSLYFASQGAGRLFWPLLGGLLRLVVAVGGGCARAGVSRARSAGVFAALSLALVLYGLTLSAAVASGAWFRPARRP